MQGKEALKLFFVGFIIIYVIILILFEKHKESKYQKDQEDNPNQHRDIQ